MKIGQIARELEVHPETIRRLERQGIIKPKRDGIGRRFFDEATIAILRARYKPKAHDQEQQRI